MYPNINQLYDIKYINFDLIYLDTDWDYIF